MGTASATVRCIGDPYGMCDCLAPAVGFGFGAIPQEDLSPLVVAMPFCSDHGVLVNDWLREHSPYPLEVHTYAIDALPMVQAEMRRDGGDVWLYERSVA